MGQLNRSELRKITMTILYQIFLYEKNEVNYNVEEVIKEQLEIDNDFVKDLVHGVLENRNNIDEYANKYLDKWPLSRLGFTDQAIIRIAIYELLYTDTPDLVCINEAIELSKNYSDDEVAKMINAVLDKIYHNKVDHE